MSWIFLATLGYFLQAFSVLGDKMILGRILPRPSSYAFWQGVLSLGVIVLTPFGFSFFGARDVLLSFLAGALWVYGLFFFFSALRGAEASRVLPAVLSLTPAILFISDTFILKNRFSASEIFAVLLLVSGSILLSLESEDKGHRPSKFLLYSLLAAGFFAGSTFLMKALFLRQTFISTLVWSRFGLFLGGLSLLAVPRFRSDIFDSARVLKSPHSSSLVVVNKLFGAVGAFLIFAAILRGPATIVNALQGAQYAFVFILAAIISFLRPQHLKEAFHARALIQKLAGIILVSSGVALISFL